jgi:hypothetical protein
VSDERIEKLPPRWLENIRKSYEESLYNDRALAEWAENYGPLLFSRIEELEEENKRLRNIAENTPDRKVQSFDE